MSPLATISASVVQKSGIGPAAYVITASDMRPRNTGNVFIKYANNTYLVIPTTNDHTWIDELSRMEDWEAENNLRLNTVKSKEITFRAQGVRRKSEPLPPLCLGIERVTELTAWCHHYWSVNGKWPCHWTAGVMFQAAVCTSCLESTRPTPAVFTRHVSFNSWSQADIRRACMVWLLLCRRSCSTECLPPQIHEAGISRPWLTWHWHSVHWQWLSVLS